MGHILLHPNIDGRLSWVHFFAVVKRAAVNTDVQQSLGQDTEFSGWMPGSGIAGSYDRVILVIEMPLHWFSHELTLHLQ